MLIDIAEHGIAFEERGQAVTCPRHLETGVDYIAEIARVAEQMARRHAGRVSRRESRE
jgi:hypothetical protein